LKGRAGALFFVLVVVVALEGTAVDCHNNWTEIV